MKLSRLHEEFLEKARQPMQFGKLPVNPKASDVPVIAVDKWIKSDSSLKKTFRFRLSAQRNDFLRQILEHEEEVGHHSELAVQKESVSVKLQTSGVDQITELDKEFAKWLDELYKDVMYSNSHV